MDLLLSFLPQEVAAKAGLFFTFLSLIFYFAEALFGYRLIRSWISALGFLFGAVIGFRITEALTGKTSYAVAGALIGGLLLSLLSYRVYLVGVFLIAAYGVYQIAQALLPLTGIVLTVVSVLLGLAAAYLAVKYMRPAIIAITAFHGGIMAGKCLPLFFSLPSGQSALTIGLILGLAGMLVQFVTSRKA